MLEDGDQSGAAEDFEVVRTRILSLFFIAKFHNKFFSPDKNEQIEATKAAIDFYKRVIDSCNIDGRVKTALEEEFRTSIDASDMLQRQLQAYQLQDDPMI